MQRPLRILTWHVHGSYLYYLSQIGHELWLPVKPGGPPGYGGRTPSFPWPENVVEIPAEEVRHESFDAVVFQSHQNWLVDQHEILSEAQRNLPRIHLEHDPPRAGKNDPRYVHDQRHPTADTDVLLVHVTHFNDLMWDPGSTDTTVIEHGVTVPSQVRWTGELERGVSVVNGLPWRGRRLGADVFERARSRLPVDLVGMGSEELGGVGEVPHHELPGFEAAYRFFFNPIRYTSLGLAVCEAMMLGLPMVGLATTEMPSVVENGVTGFVDTDVDALIEAMKALLDDHALAQRLGKQAAEMARDRFGIERFVADWERTLADAAG